MASDAQTTTPEGQWRHAQRLRNGISKELDLIQRSVPGSDELGHLEKVEDVIKSCRLACVTVIFDDFRYASEKKIPEALWQTHASVHYGYRKALTRLRQHDQVVVKRKVEKLYARYLTTAQEFYRGFLKRFCARYNMRELRRITNGTELDMSVPDQVQVDVKAENMTDIVNNFGYWTLIYLGDLSRYRTMMKAPERQSWHQALTYYHLANDLRPESGHSHHQCAVIFLEKGDSFNVLYNLLRSATSDEPHDNAIANLQREFRKLAKTTFAPKDDGEDALMFWCRKLHAIIYTGHQSRSFDELMDEVLNRFREKLTQRADSPQSQLMLLKMTVANICMHHVSAAKAARTSTAEASRSCLLALQFNLRTIHVIASLLKPQAQDILDAQGDGEEGSDGKTHFPAKFTAILPLLRVYLVWMFSCGKDLKIHADSLQPYMEETSSTLTRLIGLLLDMTSGELPRRQILPLLFEEDIETLGLRPLNGPELPGGCQLRCDPVSGQTKQRREEGEAASPVDEDDITFTRMVHILKCAFELDEHGYAPAWPESHGKLFQSEDVPVAEIDNNEVLRTEPQSQADERMETQLYQMVKSFLAPPEVGKSPKTADETSYGMGNTTANEILGAMGSAPIRTPTSATNKAFPSLPWDYFLPTATGGQVRNYGAPMAMGQQQPQQTHTEHRRQLSGQQLFDQSSKSPGLNGNLPPSPSHAVQGLPSPNPMANFSTGYPTQHAFPSSMVFSAQTSSMPPVNSPWGVPGRALDMGNNSTPSMAFSPTANQFHFSASPAAPASIHGFPASSRNLRMTSPVSGPEADVGAMPLPIGTRPSSVEKAGLQGWSGTVQGMRPR